MAELAKQLFSGGNGQVAGGFARSRDVTLANPGLLFDQRQVPTRILICQHRVGFHTFGKVDGNRTKLGVWHVLSNSEGHDLCSHRTNLSLADARWCARDPTTEGPDGVAKQDNPLTTACLLLLGLSRRYRWQREERRSVNGREQYDRREQMAPRSCLHGSHTERERLMGFEPTTITLAT